MFLHLAASWKRIPLQFHGSWSYKCPVPWNKTTHFILDFFATEHRTTNVEGTKTWLQTTLGLFIVAAKGTVNLQWTQPSTCSDCCRLLLFFFSRMFETPRSTNDEVAHSACPSPPRPNANFANISMSAALPLPSSAQLNSSPRPRPSHSRVSSATSTFSSLSSDSPQSLTLTLDDEISSSNGHPGFFLAAPATRPSAYYPTPRRRGGSNSSATAPQQGNSSSIIELQPRRSSIRFKLHPRRSSGCWAATQQRETARSTLIDHEEKHLNAFSPKISNFVKIVEGGAVLCSVKDGYGICFWINAQARATWWVLGALKM
jgi:hypothetical protein